MAQARLVLENPRSASRTLTDVAYACGFGQPSQLTQVFRSQFGIPPASIVIGTKPVRHEWMESSAAAPDMVAPRPSVFDKPRQVKCQLLHD